MFGNPSLGSLQKIWQGDPIDYDYNHDGSHYIVYDASEHDHDYDQKIVVDCVIHLSRSRVIYGG